MTEKKQYFYSGLQLTIYARRNKLIMLWMYSWSPEKNAHCEVIFSWGVELQKVHVIDVCILKVLSVRLHIQNVHVITGYVYIIERDLKVRKLFFWRLFPQTWYFLVGVQSCLMYGSFEQFAWPFCVTSLPLPAPCTFSLYMLQERVRALPCWSMPHTATPWHHQDLKEFFHCKLVS